MQASKQLPQAIECYKEALRNNPADDESRYNLALCQWQMKKHPNQDNSGEGDGQGGNDQQKDQNGDNEKQEQNQDKQQDKQQQDQQPQQQNQSQPQEEQARPQDQQKSEGISKEAAEQLLKAAMQNERKTQDRLNRYNQRKEEQEQQQAGQRRLQKNW